jgi:hypothetical protein
MLMVSTSTSTMRENGRLFYFIFFKMMSSVMADMPFWNILARQLKIGLINLWRTVCNAKISPTLCFFFLLAFAALSKETYHAWLWRR